MKTKKCSFCGTTKTINFFYSNKTGKYGVGCRCKDCDKEQAQKWRANNKKRHLSSSKKWREENHERALQKSQEWKIENIERNRQNARRWREDNPERKRDTNKQWTKKNIEKVRLYANIYARERRKEKGVRVAEGMRTAVYLSLKGEKDGRSWEKLVGYTCSELMQHLENKFTKGMSWDNYGRNGWHIDHIKPISSFNIRGKGCLDFKKCWDIENLQPLWERHNIQKGNKLDWSPQDNGIRFEPIKDTE